jgi:F-type H+-transporting ATPase subunit a
VPTNSAVKKLLFGTVVLLGLLAIVGIVGGAIGSSVLDRTPFLSQPEIHLPPQPVFPSASRNKHLGLTENMVGHEVRSKPESKYGVDPQAKPDADVEFHANYSSEKLHSTPLEPMEFAITNTMLSAWFASLVLIFIFVWGARKRSMVPGRLQSLVEVLFEGVLSFATGVLGADMARKCFPVVATIFFFVLFNAWLALLPFYQFLGFVDSDNNIKAHLLRPAGTDLNMPLALALVSFVLVEYWGFRSHGFGYLKKFFAFGSIFKKGIFQGVIDIIVGALELVSECVRIVAFTFRLFGNMTAGEILVVMITFLFPLVLTNLVYGLEILVGLIQSVIFAGLTLVFISVATSHEEH